MGGLDFSGLGAGDPVIKPAQNSAAVLPPVVRGFPCGAFFYRVFVRKLWTFVMVAVEKTLTPFMTGAQSRLGHKQALRLSIVFHSDLARIGHYADLVEWREGEAPRDFKGEVGRLSPSFSDGLPVQEAHVSRSSLTLACRGSECVIESMTDPGYVRIGVQGQRRGRFSYSDLQSGVPIRLGHAVVLLLRLVKVPHDNEETPIGALVGPSEELKRVRGLIKLAADNAVPVLLLGESGVGKDLAAQAIHEHSERAAKQFVAVNMAAIPESLAASELFGVAKGAFTGATERRGWFEHAHEGTLFLDEIGDTPSVVQAQLLRALQQGEIQVVGGRPICVDVRVIAATDADLADPAQFRLALKQRLSAISIMIPPLRERKDDIGPQLIFHLLSFGSDEVRQSLSYVASREETAAYWARVFFESVCRDWPGNSRELGAFAKTTSSKIHSGDFRRANAMQPALFEDDAQLLSFVKKRDFEMAQIARELGVSRPRLYRRLEAIDGFRLLKEVSDQELQQAMTQFGRDPRALAQHFGVSYRAMKTRLNTLLSQ